jgi:NADH:ubiquinone oxidoreductase subunit 2 (subunit N)
MHISACLWIITAAFYDDNYEGTWLDGKTDDEKFSKWDRYVLSLYWTVTTITTVGYGDISGTNNFEMLFCCIAMIVGVVAFSFANGSLTSIIQNYDSSNAQLQEKIGILNRI